VLVNVIGEPSTTPDFDEQETLEPKPNDKLKASDTIKFGKYKGKTIAEVKAENESYLRWAEANVSGFCIDWDDLY
jgi:hypothetical protein